MTPTRWLTNLIDLSHALPQNTFYQVYIIEFHSSNDQRWSVRRRFSEFSHLRDKLMMLDKSWMKTIYFPPKIMFGSNFEIAMIERRREELQHFLDKIIQNHTIRQNQFFESFMNSRFSEYSQRLQSKQASMTKYSITREKNLAQQNDLLHQNLLYCSNKD